MARTARIIIVLLVLGWLVGGPIARQVAGVRSPWLNAWYMYKGANHDICLVSWSLADGTPVDRTAVLGRPSWRTARKAERNLTSPREVHAEAARLCAALGEGADLRADARCGRYSGWVVVEDGQRDLCRPRRAR